MTEEKLYFENSNGIKLCGVLSNPTEDKQRPIIILCHGFCTSKESTTCIRLEEILNESEFSSFRIDLFGHGESEGKFEDITVKSESEDVLTAIKYVKTLNVDKEKIALMGISMGADAILMAMEKRPDVKTIVFWAPAWFFKDVYYYHTSENRKTVEEEGVFYVTRQLTGQKMIAGKELFEEFRELDIKPYMNFVEVPTLILRGSKDDVSTPEQDKEARELLNAEYVLIENGDHNFLDKRAEKELIEKTLNWFNKWLK